MNALEIRKREAKIFLLTKQLEDYEESSKGGKENVEGGGGAQNGEAVFLKKHIA